MFDVMPNASNTDRVRAAVGGEETTHDRAVLAVQGPHALERLAAVFPDAAAVGRFRVAAASWHGTPCDVAGTGYTGERGVEIAVPGAAAGDLWRAIVDEAGIRPAGLGARDTLRLEAGLPLHGNELGPGVTSLQAGLGWVVAWDKLEFAGRAAAIAEREAGVSRALVGIATEGRRPPRSGCAVLVDGAQAGTVTSGNFSPVLGHGIALAFLPPDVAEGSPVVVDVRGTSLPGTGGPDPVRPPLTAARQRVGEVACFLVVAFFRAVVFFRAVDFLAARFLAGAFVAAGAGAGGGVAGTRCRRGGGTRRQAGDRAGRRTAHRPDRRTGRAATAAATAR